MFDTLHPMARMTSRPAASADADAELLEATLAGLTASIPTLSPRWFYDALGSALFEAITRLPEYYPTRCELEILARHGRDIAEQIGPGSAVIELGCGSADKACELLGYLDAPAGYHAMDVSKAALRATLKAVRARFPDIELDDIHADFTQPGVTRALIGRIAAKQPVLLFFPGSTIGNFDRGQAVQLLRGYGRDLPDGTPFLLGVDLVKRPEIVEAAYDDSVGVTAAFNRNALAHLNRRFGSNFDPGAWRHQARWVAEHSRVEMWLYATSDQRVDIGDTSLHFPAGSGIHTESSHKWDRRGIESLAADSGWRVQDWWTDSRGYFAEVLLTRTGR